VCLEKSLVSFIFHEKIKRLFLAMANNKKKTSEDFFRTTFTRILTVFANLNSLSSIPFEYGRSRLLFYDKMSTCFSPTLIGLHINVGLFDDSFIRSVGRLFDDSLISSIDLFFVCSIDRFHLFLL
jgi:hypothetical protein